MFSIPPDLLRSLRRLGHFDEPGFVSAHQDKPAPVSVRFNPLKTVQNAAVTDPVFQSGRKIPWAARGWYLDQRPSFTQDPLFHAGLYYVQEASSMFVEQAYRCCFPEDKPIRVLDVCASPGGKSTHLQSLLSPASLLVSNEVIKSRIQALYQNMVRWGAANTVISQNDPRDFQRLPDFFDLMLVDAPCSGSGLFRKDPSAADGWSEDLVKLCSQRQQRIVADCWDILKEDGFLIYCTCSFSPQENEEVMDEIMATHLATTVRISPDPGWNILETQSPKTGAYGYRFYPDRLAGEGFYLSVLRKTAGEERAKNKNFRSGPGEKKPQKQKKSVPLPPRDWLPEGIAFISANDMTHAVSVGLADAMESLKTSLYLKKAGILCGKPGAGEWIPDHELALAAGFSIPHLPVSLNEARQYLRKELLTVAGEDRGWRILSFEGLGLGWIKKLPNRINNYYPNAWRILGKG